MDFLCMWNHKTTKSGEAVPVGFVVHRTFIVTQKALFSEFHPYFVCFSSSGIIRVISRISPYLLMI